MVTPRLPGLKNGLALVEEQNGVVDLGLAKYELEVLICSHGPEGWEVDQQYLESDKEALLAVYCNSLALTYLLVEFVGESIGHHGLAGAWWTMEQHHHPCTVRDGIVHAHLLATALVRLEVADCVEDELLLLLGENDLKR